MLDNLPYVGVYTWRSHKRLSRPYLAHHLSMQPPLALITSYILVSMSSMSAWSTLDPSVFHYLASLCWKSSNVVWLDFSILCYTIAQAFSIWLRSGLLGGHSRSLTPWSLRSYMLAMVLWHGALSYINTQPLVLPYNYLHAGINSFFSRLPYSGPLTPLLLEPFRA